MDGGNSDRNSSRRRIFCDTSGDVTTNPRSEQNPRACACVAVFVSLSGRSPLYRHAGIGRSRADAVCDGGFSK